MCWTKFYIRGRVRTEQRKSLLINEKKKFFYLRNKTKQNEEN